MSRRSLTDRIKSIFHYASRLTATNTPSNGIDITSLATVEAVVVIGAVTNAGNSPSPVWQFTLEESDSVSSGFTAVSDLDLAHPGGTGLGGSGIFARVDTAAKDDRTYRVGYLGNKKYLRVVATASNTPGNTDIAVAFVGEPFLNTAPAQAS